MDLCQDCSEWQLTLFEKCLSDIPSSREKLAQDDSYVVFRHLKEAQAVYQNRYKCWFCARFWNNLRLGRKESKNALMTDTETFDFLHSNWKTDHVALICCFSTSGRGHVARVGLEGKLPLEEGSIKGSLSAESFMGWSTEGYCLAHDRPLALAHQATSELDLRDRVRNPEKRLSLQTSEAWGHEGSNQFPSHNGVLVLPKERVSKLHDWLKFCDSHHCCYSKPPSNEQRWLPKRLLYIGKSHRVKLIKSSELVGLDIRYATLSHCWGKGEFETLTDKNFAKALKGIPRSKLGRTFNEAIELCRQLSIKYIWIDSWCIIQNSLDGFDWRQQAPEMHLVYGNAYVNIAAAASTCCHDGLLRRSQELLVRGLDVKLPKGLTLYWLGASDGLLLQDMYERSPLFRRGWVTQELLLAARTIIMTDAQLYWKCQEGFAWELVNPMQLMTEDNIHAGWKCTTVGRPAENSTRKDLDHGWKKLAVDYSATRLTRPEDRMMALAGLTARYEELYRKFETKTAFIAGQWDHNFISWLLWMSDSNTKPSLVQEQFPGLPSWSWMSCPHIVEFCANPLWLDFEYALKLIDKEIVLKGKESHVAIGQLEVARLSIAAPMFKVVSRKSKWIRTGHFRTSKLSRKNSKPEQTLELFNDDEMSLVLPVGELHVSLMVVCQVELLYDYDDFYVMEKPVECAYIGRQKDQELLNHETECFFALMVQRLGEDTHDGTCRYRRIGMLKLFFNDENDETWFGPLLQGFFEPERLKTRKFYLE